MNPDIFNNAKPQPVATLVMKLLNAMQGNPPEHQALAVSVLAELIAQEKKLYRVTTINAAANILLDQSRRFHRPEFRAARQYIQEEL